MSHPQQDKDQLIAELQKNNEQLREENELLRQKIDLLVKKVFGNSSEKIDLDQLLLFDDEAKKPAGDDLSPTDTESSPPSEKPRKKRLRREATLPKDLPTEETTLIPDEVKAKPQHYRQIGEEVTTKLDYQPATFKKLITRRPKFVKRLQALDEASDILIATLPPSLKERSLLTPRLAAQIATARFCNHQPYYRQEQHYLMRHGVHLPRSLQSQWMGYLADNYLSGIYRALHQNLLSGDYLQADETPIDYLEPGHGSTKQGYLWTISRPDCGRKLAGQASSADILYQWHPGRSAHCLEELLQTKNTRFLGILQSDGYQAYQSYQKSRGQAEIELIGCWAHVRRKFHEAHNDKAKLSGWLLKQIGQLYAIEARLREQRAGPRERERTRKLESLPIYHRLQKALLLIQKKTLPKSLLGKAVHYALGQWRKLKLCFEDGRLEIDNNLIENGIRPTKLGAKNWLFMGSEQAGQTNAIWYSLIESCRRRQLDPWAYLVWIFEELPKEKVSKDTFANYTPAAYAQKIKQLKKAS